MYAFSSSRESGELGREEGGSERVRKARREGEKMGRERRKERAARVCVWCVCVCVCMVCACTRTYML